ncbi:DUF6976 family protein [Megalodesulfovibrio paquesii]
MSQNMLNIAEAGDAIARGRVLLLAGDESALKALPRGNWIGGTIPYFMSSEYGGVATREQIFATDLTDLAAGWEIQRYDAETVAQVYVNAPENGCSFILIPASSPTHLSFALNAPNYEQFGVRPLVGWIAGVHLEDLGKQSPKVINGQTGEQVEDGALVLAVTLPAGKAASLGIINLFEQGDGDSLTFPETGFATKDVFVNGKRRNFAEYITEKQLDTKLPLVADYYGESVNISFQSVDAAQGLVQFYAPVFSGIRYKHARPVPDYVHDFKARLAGTGSVEASQLIFSCNCILNYLYSELESKKTEPFTGPITFGEIAYQLLNQTLVYVELHDV